MLEELLATRSPAAGIAGMIDYWKQVLTGSQYAMGCPILAAAQAGPSEPEVQGASAEVFATWVDKIAAALESADVEPVTAKSIASTTVSAIEGAIEQSRSARTIQPLDDVRAALTQLIEFAIPAGCR